VVNLDLALVVVSDVDACFIDGSRYPALETVRVLDALREHGVPLVFCSSKTRAELEDLQAQLDLDEPFVAENGGVLCIPQDYFPFDIPGASTGGGRLTVAFARPRAEVVARLREASAAAGVGVRAFSDMTESETSADTGLPLDAARLAMAREYDEPFRITDSDADAPERLRRALAVTGLQLVAGGRYQHVVADADKGRATAMLRRLYRKACGPLTLVGLGDALNDVPLLRSVDIPFVPQRRAAPAIGGHPVRGQERRRACHAPGARPRPVGGSHPAAGTGRLA